MGTMVTGAFSHLLAPGYRKVFMNNFKRLPEEYTHFVNVDSTSRAYEEDLIIGGAGRLEEKLQGVSIKYDNFIQGGVQRYTVRTFALGFRVALELYEDDQYGIVRKGQKLSKALSLACAQTVELEVGILLDDLFTGAVYTTVDGNPCCYTAHPLLSGTGTWTNCPGVHADLGISSLRAASQRMESTPDERGLPTVFTPRLLVVTPTFQWVAHEIFGSEKEPYTPNNTINSTREILKLQYKVSHYMSDPDQWNIFADKAQHTLTLFWRKKPVMENGDDFDTKDAKFSAIQRFSLGFTDPRGVDGSSGGA